MTGSDKRGPAFSIHNAHDERQNEPFYCYCYDFSRSAAADKVYGTT